MAVGVHACVCGEALLGEGHVGPEFTGQEAPWVRTSTSQGWPFTFSS